MIHMSRKISDKVKGLTSKAQSRVHRIAATPELVAAAKKQMSEQVSTMLRGCPADAMKTSNGPGGRAQNDDFNSAFPDFATLHSGINLISAPWDWHWEFPNDTTQFVQGFTDTEQSMAIYCEGSNKGNSSSGFGAGGFGVLLSSPITRQVSIEPYMPCEFEYQDWSNLYSANTRGGFGVGVYDGNLNTVPGTEYLTLEVWNQTTSGVVSGDTKTDPPDDTKTDPLLYT